MQSPEPVVIPAEGSPVRILVADDEEKNRRLMRDILESHGYQVLLAEDGQKALDMAVAAPPDVILLDIMMPKLDGYEVCERLRKDARTGHLPILMITALDERADRLRGIQVGANDFLTKPIDAGEIRLRIRNAVRSKRLHDRLQEAYQQLQTLEKLRENLTHMIIHDMRTPLMGLSMSLEIIASEPDTLHQKRKEFIVVAQNACHELTDMVSLLLDVSRMEAGQMPLNRVACDIRGIAQAAVDSVVALAWKKTLTLRVTGNSVGGDVDRDIIHRVFVNLLGNAIKFSPPDATITIEVAATGGAVRCVVTDQSMGIPQEYHQRIFEKFGQVGTNKESAKYSTGLGLAFCKLAVEAHGGQIGVASEVGRGSSFWFTLPSVS